MLETTGKVFAQGLLQLLFPHLENAIFELLPHFFLHSDLLTVDLLDKLAEPLILRLQDELTRHTSPAKPLV